jgi:hypothetical protein
MSNRQPDDDASGKTGRWLGIPYDWRKPSWARFKSRVWNANDPRLWTPKTFGWGFDINFHALWQKIRRR